MEVLNSHFSALSQPFCRKTCLTSRATSRLFVALSRPTVFIPATLVFGGFDPPSESNSVMTRSRGTGEGGGQRRRGGLDSTILPFKSTFARQKLTSNQWVPSSQGIFQFRRPMLMKQSSPRTEVNPHPLYVLQYVHYS